MNDKMNMCISVNTVLIEKNTQNEVYNMDSFSKLYGENVSQIFIKYKISK